MPVTRHLVNLADEPLRQIERGQRRTRCILFSMTLLALLVAVVLLGLGYWAITKIAAAFGLPQQITVVLQVLIVIAAVLWLLGEVGITGPTLRLR